MGMVPSDTSHLIKKWLGCTLGWLLDRESSKRKEPYGLVKGVGVGKTPLNKKRVQILKGLLTTVSKGNQGQGTRNNNHKT